MAFRILASETLDDAVRRIAREQIDEAIAEVDDSDLASHKTVHQVRKRCKKVRGLLRLVRFELRDAYARENRAFRDAARLLSHVRDFESRLETFDALLEHFGSTIDGEAFQEMREGLAAAGDDAVDERNVEGRLSEFRDRMLEASDRVGSWPSLEHGFGAMREGLRNTYFRGRTAMSRAYSAQSPEHFHEWRKRAKYHLYDIRLLRCIWEAPMKARREEAERLSDWLGDDHDLFVLRAALLDRKDLRGDSIETMVALIDRRSVELRNAAKPLGARLFAEKPKRLVELTEAYWDAWRAETAS